MICIMLIHNCSIHVDATQAVGKTDIILDGVDTLSLSAHKFYGLNGTGLLYKRKELIIEPLIHGGVSTTIALRMRSRRYLI